MYTPLTSTNSESQFPGFFKFTFIGPISFPSSPLASSNSSKNPCDDVGTASSVFRGLDIPLFDADGAEYIFPLARSGLCCGGFVLYLLFRLVPFGAILINISTCYVMAWWERGVGVEEEKATSICMCFRWWRCWLVRLRLLPAR